ncbi:MAG TPA: isoprenylcysteine carboxylmethyltransferase family protein [Pseudolabrys sp.]|nr:isoprenylcysteine carboxylmethyltransferase family protein [Pseudolabrys sp.]
MAQDMTEGHETAGVIAPPPLIALAAVLVGLFLDWLAPAYILTLLLSLETRVPLGLLLIVLGCLLGYGGVRSFRRAATAVNPYAPSTTLATTGVYAYLRNPMYLGLGLIVGGLGIALASDWMLVMLVAAALTIHFGVVKREERYLTAKFGEAYVRYRAAVPRYGLRAR